MINTELEISKVTLDGVDIPVVGGTISPTPSETTNDLGLIAEGNMYDLLTDSLLDQIMTGAYIII